MLEAKPDSETAKEPLGDQEVPRSPPLAAVEARVRRKLDTHVLLLLWILFLLAFLDRSNIGNARIAGLETDLDLSGDQYEWLLTIFYIAYILFEPLIIAFKVLPARIWIAILVLGWGIAATAQSATQSWGGMMACRFFMAAFEAGYGPGAIYLLSFFYLRNELGLRIGIFFASAPLATCFAGALAYGITSGHSKIANWRLLFLVEGAPVLVMAAVAYFAMPNSAHQAWFLDEHERDVALARQVKQVGKGTRVGSLKWRETLSILLDVKAWLTALMYFSCNVSYSSLPVFLPTILKDMGFSGLTAQGLSAPPYFASFLVTIATTYLADRTQQRGLMVMAMAALGGAGYVMLAAASTTAVRYAGAYLAAAGVFPTIANILPWVVNNQGSDERRGAGVVIINLVGQCGPLLGTRVYPQDERPHYVRGHGICAAFMFFVALLACILRILLLCENKRLAEKHGDNVVANDANEQGVENYGPNFRYVL
ncbi:Major facilitator superfamily domain, general substrate transporter [Metarhizium album ARSEF 1941]|uniref:Major facilitator superfamily domain, general substrate transporter n=1 Tax=Metarhizium album (strain ARSEF 1941) TaxID=1081103 RepID=A0A0B2WJP3_METAS|nr:Major facilitator superfamily domain, general substrate transporter [Metarhizium album ARSEF 1941]KHN93924.1 Major facilitator superfamily domain, general substrate transporter [Metarhizium album ARSEF 1941]